MPSPGLELPLSRPGPVRCGPPRKSRRALFRALALVGVHVAILVHVAHWKITGSTLTPMEPSESMQTLENGYVNAGFVLFVAAIVLTLVFGRFFCGWACHVVAYQDLCAWILKKLKLRPGALRSRLLVFVPLGAALYMFVWPQVLRLDEGRAFPTLRAHFSTDSFWQTFPGPLIATLTILVDGFLVVWFLGAKGFCTYGCPYGAFFGVADRFARGRIRVTDACEGCGHCTATCTSNVRVHEEVALHKMVVDPGCMKCLDCVNVCPKDALYFGFGGFGPARSTSPARARTARSFDFAWSEEILAAVVFLLALYGARDLYHQVPFLLAIGVSVLAAASAIALVRLFRRRDLSLQHLVLKADGRITKSGLAFAAVAILFLAFLAESGVMQYREHEGERRLREARSATGNTRARLVREGLDHLLAADRLALFPDWKHDLAVASLAEAAGDTALAEKHATRSASIEKGAREPRLLLASLRLRRGDADGARAALEEVLAIDPKNADAQSRLAALRAGVKPN